MAKFEVGKKYYCRSICDHECVWEFTVTARTAKTVTLLGEDGRIKKRRISDDKGEFVLPLGNYSMCPILRAENEV